MSYSKIGKWRLSIRKVLIKIASVFYRQLDDRFVSEPHKLLKKTLVMRSHRYSDQICTNLIRFGWEGYESPFPSLIARICNRGNIVFVDVGANTGFYSLLACSAGAEEVFSFEPVVEIARIMRDNVRLSGLDSSIEIHDLALSNQIGRVRIWIPSSARSIETSASIDP